MKIAVLQNRQNLLNLSSHSVHEKDQNPVMEVNFNSWADDWRSILRDVNLAHQNIKILLHDNAKVFRLNHEDVCLTLYYQQLFIVTVQLAKIFSTSKQEKLNASKLFQELRNLNSQNPLSATTILQTIAALESDIDTVQGFDARGDERR